MNDDGHHDHRSGTPLDEPGKYSPGQPPQTDANNIPIPSQLTS